MVDAVRSRADFVALGRSRHRGRSGPIRVAWVPDGDDRPTIAVAYAVGRGVGNAVVRNRLRRRLRPLMVDLETSAALSPGAYLVGAGPDAVDLSAPDLARHLTAAVLAATGRR